MNLFPKKSLGQNFLIDKNIINLITEIGEINKKNSIIEVGPGKGSLTEKILEREPKDFTVIEKDERLIDILHEKFGSKIKIINKDMMKVEYSDHLKKKFDYIWKSSLQYFNPDAC